MDRIEIRGLRVTGHHGVFPEEQRDGQPFVVDATLDVDLTAASESDDLADTVDYGSLAAVLAEQVRATRFDLIERLAGHLLTHCLADPRVLAAEVRIAKPEAPVPEEIGEVAVVLRRTRT